LTIIILNSENLILNWFSSNIEDFKNFTIIIYHLLKHFILCVLIDNTPNIKFHGFKKRYKVSIRQYTGSKGYWVGTKIIFSSKDVAYFYKLVKTQSLIEIF